MGYYLLSSSLSFGMLPEKGLGMGKTLCLMVLERGLLLQWS